MNENGSKRRDWVKNAAIIFLAVMLVLTFFSNTIMNYSLPEVAVQYVQSGSITAQIRGSGVVESDDPYDVIFAGSRKVESVMVREGDTVQAGDILFLLGEGDSAELETLQQQVDAAQDNVDAAQKNLDSAVNAIEKAILEGQISGTTAQHIQNGVSSSLSSYMSRVSEADAKVADLEKQVDEINVAIGQLETAISNLQNQGAPDVSAQQAKVNNAQAALNANKLYQADADIANYTAKINERSAKIEQYEKYAGVSGGDAVSGITKEEYEKAKSELSTYNELKKNAEQVKNGATQADKDEYSRLQSELSKARTELSDAQNWQPGSIAAYQRDLANWRSQLEPKQKELQQATEERTKLLNEISYEMDGGAGLPGVSGNITELREALSDAKEQLQKAQDKVDEERAKSGGTSVTAPISGTVSSINVTAGHDTSEADPNPKSGGYIVATMMPEGVGYTMSFSVTNDQAKTLTPGTQADLVNAWRYDDVTVTLASIRPDTQNPSQQKKLVFNVTGNVTVGQSLSVQVGDRSANYDMIVPNSAIREDSNGKFVLTITSKATPLSTRYTATRVDVEVVASDDTRSAITGGLYTYDYVITTSDIPVNAGQQVRLSGN